MLAPLSYPAIVAPRPVAGWHAHIFLRDPQGAMARRSRRRNLLSQFTHMITGLPALGAPGTALAAPTLSGEAV